MSVSELIIEIDRILSEKKEKKEILNYTYEKDYETDSVRFITEAYISKKIKFLIFCCGEKLYLSKRILEINEVKHSLDKSKVKVKIKEYKSNIDVPAELLKKKSKYYIKINGQFDYIFSLFNDFLTFQIGIKTFDRSIKKVVIF